MYKVLCHMLESHTQNQFTLVENKFRGEKTNYNIRTIIPCTDNTVTEEPGMMPEKGGSYGVLRTVLSTGRKGPASEKRGVSDMAKRARCLTVTICLYSWTTVSGLIIR